MKKVEYNFAGDNIKLHKFQNDYSKSFEEISQKAKSLANAIKNCKEYREYLEAKERLEQDAMNRKVLRELRDQQFTVQFSPVDDDFERKFKFLNEMYMAVSLNPVISDYLNAEYRFGLIVDELKKDFEGVFAFEENLSFGEVLKAEYEN